MAIFGVNPERGWNYVKNFNDAKVVWFESAIMPVYGHNWPV